MVKIGNVIYEVDQVNIGDIFEIDNKSLIIKDILNKDFNKGDLIYNTINKCIGYASQSVILSGECSHIKVLLTDLKT